MTSQEHKLDLTPLEYVKSQKDHFRDKANRNKRIVNYSMAIIILSSVMSPVFILISNDFWISKLVPSLLGSLAAFCTYWIQLKKPQEKWILFRTAEKEIESEISNFIYSCDQKKENENELAVRVSKYVKNVHQSWIPLVPIKKDFELLQKSN